MSQASLSCLPGWLKQTKKRAEELNLSLSGYLRKCADREHREQFLKPGPKRRLNQKGAR